CLTFGFYRVSLVFAFIVKRFRVFRAPLHCFFLIFFRIYRETLSRFCAPLHWSTKTVIFSAESWPCFQIEPAAGGQSGATC
ncbi:hypothetical protein ACJ8BA_28325, partial [Klebsiella pneumoniae]